MENSIIKIAVLPKVMYRFNVSLSKFQGYVLQK